MKVQQQSWSTTNPRPLPSAAPTPLADPQLVLAFAAPEAMRADDTWPKLRALWPHASIVLGSTAGEIQGTQVLDGSLVATALSFEKSRVRCARVDLSECESSEKLGSLLGSRLSGDDLRHVFVLSDGLKVNGSALVRGLAQALPSDVSLSGGLCGDGPRFERTQVCLDGPSDVASVVAVGFYGRDLHVGMGSMGGWDPFGPERLITRSIGNVLFELDGQPALALYEKYLGEHAAGLPATGLRFPLTVRAPDEKSALVRTLLAIDREQGSVTFAGDVPEGHYARLMHGTFDRLVEGAAGAARTSAGSLGQSSAQLAILISCVGRKLVLKQRVEEEVEGVQAVLGADVPMTGFYSYGEISPFSPEVRCELHNQTMTITTLSEGA
jgi:hypothetical protein